MATTMYLERPGNTKASSMDASGMTTADMDRFVAGLVGKGYESVVVARGNKRVARWIFGTIGGKPAVKKCD